MLTQEDLEQYRERGDCVYRKPLFSEEKFKRLKAIFEEHLERKGEKLSDELDTPHFHDERLLEFCLSDEVLDLVEPIVGPNIVLWTSHFICKDPYTGRATPWHEDSSYWNGRFDRYDNIVTVWLAIDRATKENGCMKVIPGTHKNGGFSEYEEVDRKENTFATRIKNLDTSGAVYIELEPNQCSLHDSRLIHGADANRSPHRRCGYTMRYFPSDTKVHHDFYKNKGWKFWLARGRDLAGNSYVNV